MSDKEKITRRLYPLILASLLLVIALVLIVSAGEFKTSPPHSFNGTAAQSNGQVAANNVVSARTSGEEVGSYVIDTAGHYGNDGYMGVAGWTDNSTIKFYICNIDTGQSATYEAGKITRLDLSITDNCPVKAAAAAAAAAGGGAGAAEGGGGAAVSKAPAEAVTTVTDEAVISAIKASLPADWTNIKVEQVGEAKSATVTATVSQIDKALEQATAGTAIAVLNEIKEMLSSGQWSGVNVVVTLNHFQVTNQDTGAKLDRTQFTLTITAPSKLENFKLVEIIPKDVAASIDEVVFPDTVPLVLQSDPIVEWEIASLEKGVTKTFSYIIKKKVEAISSITLAAGKVIPEAVAPPEAPVEAKKPFDFTGIIIIIVIVAVGLVAYYAYKAVRKRR